MDTITKLFTQCGHRSEYERYLRHSMCNAIIGSEKNFNDIKQLITECGIKIIGSENPLLVDMQNAYVHFDGKNYTIEVDDPDNINNILILTKALGVRLLNNNLTEPRKFRVTNNLRIATHDDLMEVMYSSAYDFMIEFLVSDNRMRRLWNEHKNIGVIAEWMRLPKILFVLKGSQLGYINQLVI